MTLKRSHKHDAVTIHAIRQRAGVPYHVERKVTSSALPLRQFGTVAIRPFGVNGRPAEPSVLLEDVASDVLSAAA